MPYPAPFDPARYALHYARKYYRAAFERWPEDARQTVHVAVLAAREPTLRGVGNAVKREMDRLYRDLGVPRYQVARRDPLRFWSHRATRRWSAQRLVAAGVDVRKVADDLGYSARYARQLAPARTEAELAPLRRAWGRQGGTLGARARWPGWEERAAAARAMRAAGSTLREIGAALGLSEAGAHYAARERGAV